MVSVCIKISVKIMEYVKINLMEVINVYVHLDGKDDIVLKVSLNGIRFSLK